MTRGEAARARPLIHTPRKRARIALASARSATPQAAVSIGGHPPSSTHPRMSPRRSVSRSCLAAKGESRGPWASRHMRAPPPPLPTSSLPDLIRQSRSRAVSLRKKLFRNPARERTKKYLTRRREARLLRIVTTPAPAFIRKPSWPRGRLIHNAALLPLGKSLGERLILLRIIRREPKLTQIFLEVVYARNHCHKEPKPSEGYDPSASISNQIGSREVANSAIIVFTRAV